MAKQDPSRQTHHLTAAYGVHVVDLVARWGVSAEDLLDGFGFSRDDLATPDRSLPLDVAVALFERARALTGEPRSASISASRCRPRRTGWSASRR